MSTHYVYLILLLFFLHIKVNNSCNSKQGKESDPTGTRNTQTLRNLDTSSSREQQQQQGLHEIDNRDDDNEEDNILFDFDLAALSSKRSTTFPELSLSTVFLPSPSSGQRVRLRGGGVSRWGYLEVFSESHGRWGLVCDSGKFTWAEADLVCWQLGYKRGASSTKKGIITNWMDVNIAQVLTEGVTCFGHEKTFQECDISYISQSVATTCDVKDIVSISCRLDSVARCEELEVPYGDSCYHIHHEGKTFFEAREECMNEGKWLAEMDSQAENDFISESLWSFPALQGVRAQFWIGWPGESRKETSGGSSSSRVATAAPKQKMFRQWWPGWNNELVGPLSLSGISPMAVKLTRFFDHNNSSNNNNDDRMIDRAKPVAEKRQTDYYFWSLEVVKTELGFICEGPQKDIGCFNGRGVDYEGKASRDRGGKQCQPWGVRRDLKTLGEETVRRLEGNNFCRNPANTQSTPWCWIVGENGLTNSSCDIPQCPLSFLPEGATCGISSQSPAAAASVARVVSGQTAQPGAFPWAASIRRYDGVTSSHYCGAVVLDELHLLTAAHCMRLGANRYVVRVGDWDKEEPDPEEQEFSIDSMQVHENYNSAKSDYDVALIRVKRNVRTNRGMLFGDNVGPACLPSADLVYSPGINCTAVGWGQVNATVPEARLLQFAQLPIVERQQCRGSWGNIGPREFCAGFMAGGSDTCDKDSGGGLVCDVRGRWTALGITNRGHRECGKKGYPGVYAKVNEYLKWIEETGRKFDVCCRKC